jgi:hypothetical protein
MGNGVIHFTSVVRAWPVSKGAMANVASKIAPAPETAFWEGSVRQKKMALPFVFVPRTSVPLAERVARLSTSNNTATALDKISNPVATIPWSAHLLPNAKKEAASLHQNRNPLMNRNHLLNPSRNQSPNHHQLPSPWWAMNLWWAMSLLYSAMSRQGRVMLRPLQDQSRLSMVW